MTEPEEKIERLQTQLDKLVKTQVEFQREVSQIRYEIGVLRAVQQKRNLSATEPPESAKKPPVRDYVPPPKPAETPAEQPTNQKTNYQSRQQTASPNFESSPKPESSANRETPPISRSEKSDLEKFIGENLISKIGIVILVLGVAIGAKYAIDNNLISPLARIITGYVFGFGLLGFAVKLKDKYHNFSAVLLSGAMAIMYFITFAAYSYYGLMTQSAAFVLMLIFTVFTVLTAVIYDRVVIAHIGLVGAYTIPFLLSDNSGNYAFLFSYMAIINAGILAVSIKKYWKSLYYSSFVITWLTFSGWYLSGFRAAEHFTLALTFAAVFFFIFYLTFLVYKTISDQELKAENVVLILANSFIFYGLGFSIIESRADVREFLGLFTMFNAGFHFVVAVALTRLKSADQTGVYLASALVLTFITIAVTVQFDGNWTTLLWTAEAAILFWIGRTKQIPLYEYYSYPLMLLASISLFDDWTQVYQLRGLKETALFPLFNKDFLTSILFVAAFGFIAFLNKDRRYQTSLAENFYKMASYSISAVFLFALYNTFRMEIGNYFHFQSVQTAVRDFNQNTVSVDNNLDLFNFIWQINYSALFLSILSFVNIKRIKNADLGFVNLALNAICLLVFLVGGLYVLGELRETWLLQTNAEVFNRGIFHILIRYVSFAFVAALIYSIYEYFRQDFISEYFPKKHLDYVFDFIFYVSILIIVSSELINWMDIFGYNESYKLGLSILWGLYSLFLIVLGIARGKKHLRVGAISLFAVTLAKLFFYDIAELDTISKTVVFVSLGILLLIISFLYNKYKNLISGEEIVRL